ncbi:helix-turn-helix domain-containing protein [Lactiplantibacillus plantarum]|uniref:helix-turn-helix domain-containing protein n=1 Tax=Lactiplantibacillus plantarum TaxID=1590 RepID=UPI000931555D|nr:helix-turn-helix transcriptional regulator [Lactiplantibacillus plantarum]
MIIFHLKELLQQQKISQNKFARMTGIRPNTINDLVNNKTKRLEIATFNKILKVIVRWGYALPDFIEYKEKNNEKF